jgi:hypothetical protein
LQLFLDGTAVSAAQGKWADRSNVFRLMLALHYEGNQIVFYMPGVGTRGDVLSTITARGLDEIVREAYVHLACNYLKGDEIDIFGYSRGGVAALALAAMISEHGLLWADDLDHLHGIWRLFTGGDGLSDNERQQLNRDHVAGRVREAGDTPVINFLGVFDPVEGNGWDRFDFFSRVRLRRPHKLGDVVRAGVNILSIDDNRNPSYSPILWAQPSESGQSMQQIWMPGVHGDIGGNAEGLFLSDIALLTMIGLVRAHRPQLIWDDVVIEELEDGLPEHRSVSVSNERFDWKRKVLLKADRTIGSAGESANEFLHPVFDLLHGRDVKIRGLRQKYAPMHVPLSMNRFTSERDELFKQACASVFQRMQSG